MNHYNPTLSLDATIMVSQNCLIVGEHVVITQVVKLGLRFRLSFFYFLRSVTNRRLDSTTHASLMHGKMLRKLLIC